MREWEKRILRAAPGLIAAVVALTSAPVAQAATTVYVVDDDQSECATTYNNSNWPDPLQKAIDDALTNNVRTIQVCAGQYDQFWVIGFGGGLKIVAKDPDNRPEIVAPSTTNSGYIVLVQDSKNVVLDGLYINGGPFQDTPGGQMTGIYYYNATGAIQNSVVYHIRATTLANASGVGIDAQDDNADGQASSVTIKNNLISMFDSYGIRVVGPVKASVSGNQIDGANGDTSEAPFSGIQMRAMPSGVPAGSISKNLINFTVRGIWLTDVSGMKVTTNVIRQSVESAVEIDSRCGHIINGNGTGANKNLISGNTFVKTPVGVYIALVADGALPSLCNPRADLNAIMKNTMLVEQLASLRTMVYIETSTLGGSGFVPGAVKTKVTGNKGMGFTLSFFTNDVTHVTNTVETGNRLVHR